MKRIVLLILISFCYISVSAQTNSSKKVFVLKSNVARPAKTIPLIKATTVRKDAMKLKLQLNQFSDPFGIVKKDLDATIYEMRDDVDSMPEMGETESSLIRKI